jgi:hypothetical protein
MGGRRAVRAPAMATSHSIYEDLLFSLVCKSRPRHNESSLVEEWCRTGRQRRDKDLYRASIGETGGKAMGRSGGSTPRGMARWRPMGMDYHGESRVKTVIIITSQHHHYEERNQHDSWWYYYYYYYYYSYNYYYTGN